MGLRLRGWGHSGCVLVSCITSLQRLQLRLEPCELIVHAGKRGPAEVRRRGGVRHDVRASEGVRFHCKGVQEAVNVVTSSSWRLTLRAVGRAAGSIAQQAAMSAANCGGHVGPHLGT